MDRLVISGADTAFLLTLILSIHIQYFFKGIINLFPLYEWHHLICHLSTIAHSNSQACQKISNLSGIRTHVHSNNLHSGLKRIKILYMSWPLPSYLKWIFNGNNFPICFYLVSLMKYHNMISLLFLKMHFVNRNTKRLLVFLNLTSQGARQIKKNMYTAFSPI